MRDRQIDIDEREREITEEKGEGVRDIVKDVVEGRDVEIEWKR